MKNMVMRFQSPSIFACNAAIYCLSLFISGIIVSAFLETINFNNQVIYLRQGCKVTFSKPIWVHITVRFVCAIYARGGGSPAPTSEPKIVVVKVNKGAKIRNRYNQVPHPTQDTNGKVTLSQ